MSTPVPPSIDATLELLKGGDYIADRSLATVLYLALKLGRPLFCEGEAGVGKTEIAKVLAATLKRPLIRLQCYEGLDVNSAVYEWNYSRQMIEIRLAEAQGVHDRGQLASDIFDERFLIRRPLLEALSPHPEGAPILLIDELDRTDEPFEAYLLEVLSDFQVTIPELGTIKAAQTPIVIITSNRTREIHDALKRRCFYHWVDYPDLKRELEILKVKAPGASERLSRQVVGFVQELRKLDLFKAPGVAESIDWATALSELNALDLDPKTINDTLGVLLKYQDDIQRLQGIGSRRDPAQGEVRHRRPAAGVGHATGIPSAFRSARVEATSCRWRAGCSPRSLGARLRSRWEALMDARSPGTPERRHGMLANNIVHFARTLRTAGLRVGPGQVLRAVEAVEAAGLQEARRLLLDAALGVREPPRPARDLRPGVPRLLAQSAAPREDDGDAAAVGRRAGRSRRQEAAQPPPAGGAAARPRRGAQGERTSRPRSRSRRPSPSPTARSCSTATSSRCRRPRSTRRCAPSRGCACRCRCAARGATSRRAAARASTSAPRCAARCGPRA